MNARPHTSSFTNPYTPQNVEAAISHLEHVLKAGGATQLFNGAYWRARISQASATPGLLPAQRSRLERLFGSVAVEA
ncbi:hypothetical protein [Paraburkholderia phosphatilytica]|uniref:hypothetical protein n=1 Tax=Paraburkholderia phosphatilytica TaxID=2282883 RepID=UPI000E4FF037|nr:hypothetical protein [Paraburkholderia phosphatilytica]